MPEPTDDPDVPEWVRRMRAKGYTVRIGTGTGGIPFEPEVAFTPPVTDEADRPEEPYWVARLRADGYTVRVGTDPTPLPLEPEDHFGPPYAVENNLRSRLMSVVQKLWQGIPGVSRS